MKKLALSITLFLAFTSSAFAACTRADFIGKWWLQDSKGVSAAFINGSNKIAIAPLSGAFLNKRGNIERGEVKIYAKACRITLLRSKSHDDNESNHDDDNKVINQGGILERSKSVTGEQRPSVIIMDGATLYRNND